MLPDKFLCEVGQGAIAKWGRWLQQALLVHARATSEPRRKSQPTTPFLRKVTLAQALANLPRQAELQRSAASRRGQHDKRLWTLNTPFCFYPTSALGTDNPSIVSLCFRTPVFPTLTVVDPP